MCGISGFLDRTGELDAAELTHRAEAMAATLLHRGPDDAGTWVDHDAGVGLGHRRLAIIDLSPHGRQPMVSQDGRYVLCFNGEIYNHRDMRRSLEGAGAVFRGTSDTEVLLEAIAAWGHQEALRRSNGMFAWALWDRPQRRLILARDRLGEKPLYYGRFGDCFLFGSELKALRAHPAFEGRVDRDALALYLRLCYVPAPWSIYEGVRKLPPGTTLTVGGAAEEPRPFWSAEEAANRGIADRLREPPGEVLARLEALLRESVRLRMVADVPLGAFLSGGIDSSLVVALMQAESSRPVRTFTIGFEEDGFDEARYARAVAAHLGTDHTELYVTPTAAMDVIPRMPAIYDEPFADSSQVPTTLLAELTRREVTVSLSGDGGDELFIGYDRYLLFKRPEWRLIDAVPGALRRPLAYSLSAVPPHVWDRCIRLAARAVPGLRGVARAGQKVHRLADVLRRPGVAGAYPALVSHWDGGVARGAHEPATPLTDPARWLDVGAVTDRVSYLDLITYLPDDLLVKVDRATMAVGLEARVPFLDHRVVELAWRIPPALKVRRGAGKWITRQLLGRFVPPSLFERPKMGFGVPVGEWICGPLRDWAEDLLSGSRLASDGFLDPEPVRCAWQEHLAGDRDWQHRLWAVLMFEAWLDSVRSSPVGSPT